METQWENQTRRNQTLLSPTSLLTYSEFLSQNSPFPLNQQPLNFLITKSLANIFSHTNQSNKSNHDQTTFGDYNMQEVETKTNYAFTREKDNSNHFKTLTIKSKFARIRMMIKKRRNLPRCAWVSWGSRLDRPCRNPWTQSNSIFTLLKASQKSDS